MGTNGGPVTRRTFRITVLVNLHNHEFITARIQTMGKALFSQVSVCPQGEGVPREEVTPSTGQVGVAPARSGWGYCPPPPFPGQNSTASTCYAAGCMPFAPWRTVLFTYFFSWEGGEGVFITKRGTCE